MNIMQFSSVWLKLTRTISKQNLAMRYFILMDANDKGYLIEEEFVRGWTDLAIQGDGSTILQRCSSLSSKMAPPEFCGPPVAETVVNEPVDDIQPTIDDEPLLPGILISLSHALYSLSIQKPFMRRLYQSLLKFSSHLITKN